MIVVIKQISFIGWNSYITRTFLFQIKQGKEGSSIQSVNDLKPDPRNIFDKQIALFIDILLRDSARE